MTVLARREPLPPPLKFSMDTQHCNREDPGDALGLGNEETHTVGNITILQNSSKQNVLQVCLLLPPIPKQFQHAHICSLTFVLATRVVLRAKPHCSPGDCPAADSRTVKLSPEITLSLSRTGKEALLFWALGFKYPLWHAWSPPPL